MAYITPEIIVISKEELKMLTATRRGGGEPFLHSEIREISKCGLRKHEYLKQVINYFNR